MKKIVVILCLGLLVSFTIFGQNLTPFPKRLQTTTGSFTFKTQMPVSVVNTSDFNRELVNQILEDTGIEAQNVDKKTRKQAGFLIEKCVSAADLKLKLRTNNLDDTFNPEAEGYVLNISGNGVHLFALKDAGIFYGIQTLKQLLQNYGSERIIPAMTIYDKPDFAVRAWQDDISRGPIPTMEMLKQEIKTMASFKLNYFTLYTEQVFKLESHPTIAPEEGITKEQISELSAFAKDYQVTLIGNYQSFGHMEKSLNRPGYKHLLESGHIISPVMDESYQFLDDVYKEVVPAYSGEYFNINCDETFGLGEGKSKALFDSIGIAGIYALHINRLNDLLKKYGKKILMWGDIAASHPDIVSALPKDITVIVWGYHAAENFDYAILPISDQGLNFWVAPGVNCWSNVYPDMKSAEINIYNFIRDAYKLNATGVLNTSWDDDGLNFFNDTWHGFAWGAENSWNAPPDLETTASDKELAFRYARFNRAFDAQFYGLNVTDESITSIMWQLATLHQSGIRDALKNSRFFEPIFPIHADYIQKGKKEENALALSRLDSLASRLEVMMPLVKDNKSTLDYLLYGISRAQFTLKKNLFRISVNDYLNEPSNESESKIKGTKSELIEELGLLKKEYIRLWNNENRAYWLDVNEKQFDKIIESLQLLDGYILFEPLNQVDEQGRQVRMRSVFNDYPIHYAINADTVTMASPEYIEPIYVDEDATIMARSIDKNIEFPIQWISLIYHKGIGRLLKLTSPYSDYHPAYDGGGEYALLDGQLGKPEDLKSGLWQGFGGSDIEIEIDLGKKEPLQSFSMGFFQHTDIWVIFPKQVEIYIKDKADQEYKLFTTIKGKVPPEAKGSLKENYTASLNGIQPRYMKVIARYYGKLPEWHPAGSGYDSMIFSDEIILR